MHERLCEDPLLKPLAARLEDDVRAGRAAPPAAARRLLDAFFAGGA